jgi:hypothetical protein
MPDHDSAMNLESLTPTQQRWIHNNKGQNKHPGFFFTSYAIGRSSLSCSCLLLTKMLGNWCSLYENRNYENTSFSHRSSHHPWPCQSTTTMRFRQASDKLVADSASNTQYGSVSWPETAHRTMTLCRNAIWLTSYACNDVLSDWNEKVYGLGGREWFIYGLFIETHMSTEWTGHAHHIWELQEGECKHGHTKQI